MDNELKRTGRLLRKVKLNRNGGLTIEWKDTYFNEKENTTATVDEARTSNAVAHSDFHAALNTMREHLMFACEFARKPKEGIRPAFDGSTSGTDKFFVGSMTLRGGEEEKPVSVHLYGRKKITSGHVVNFGTYGIKLDHAQEPYSYAAELHQHVENLEAEAWAYLEGKTQPPAQTSLDLTGAGADERSTTDAQE
jgi:hypothetical protein